MNDVMHGPTVRVKNRRKRKTYLIAFIDDATRPKRPTLSVRRTTRAPNSLNS